MPPSKWHTQLQIVREAGAEAEAEAEAETLVEAEQHCDDVWFARKCSRRAHECTLDGPMRHQCRRTCGVCSDAFVADAFSDSRMEEHVRTGASILAGPEQPPRATPIGRVAGLRSPRPPWGHLITPTALGLEQLGSLSPEDFFARVLLPAVPRRSGTQLIVDVGANVGQFAMTIANAGHDGLCFEAAPPTCRILQGSVAAAAAAAAAVTVPGRLRGTVSVRCVAVGREAGNVSFTMSGARNASFALARHSSTEHARTRIDVPMVTLDDELPNASMLLLKIDTQGFDMDVLQGAARLLQRRAARLLLIEMSHELLNRAGSSPLYLMQHIARTGYVCTFLRFFVGIPNHRYRRIPTPLGLITRRSVSFEIMDQLLGALPPSNKSGWTDLLCW